MLHQLALTSGVNKTAVGDWTRKMFNAGRLEEVSLAPGAAIYLFDGTEIIIIIGRKGPDQQEARIMIYSEEVDASLRFGGAFNLKER